MLGLRLDARAADLAWAGPPDRPEALERLRGARACCARDGGALALTREGRFVQNAVLHELMEYA